MILRESRLQVQDACKTAGVFAMRQSTGGYSMFKPIYAGNWLHVNQTTNLPTNQQTGEPTSSSWYIPP